jgi:hypothetical protein
MIFNASKMFMEVNPVLYDKCTIMYRESKESRETHEKERAMKWDMLEQMAKFKSSSDAMEMSVAPTPHDSTLGGDGPLESHYIQSATSSPGFDATHNAATPQEALTPHLAPQST